MRRGATKKTTRGMLGTKKSKTGRKEKGSEHDTSALALVRKETKKVDKKPSRHFQTMGKREGGFLPEREIYDDTRDDGTALVRMSDVCERDLSEVKLVRKESGVSRSSRNRPEDHVLMAEGSPGRDAPEDSLVPCSRNEVMRRHRGTPVRVVRSRPRSRSQTRRERRSGRKETNEVTETDELDPSEQTEDRTGEMMDDRDGPDQVVRSRSRSRTRRARRSGRKETNEATETDELDPSEYIEERTGEMMDDRKGSEQVVRSRSRSRSRTRRSRRSGLKENNRATQTGGLDSSKHIEGNAEEMIDKQVERSRRSSSRQRRARSRSAGSRTRRARRSDEDKSGDHKHYTSSSRPTSRTRTGRSRSRSNSSRSRRARALADMEGEDAFVRVRSRSVSRSRRSRREHTEDYPSRSRSFSSRSRKSSCVTEKEEQDDLSCQSRSVSSWTRRSHRRSTAKEDDDLSFRSRTRSVMTWGRGRKSHCKSAAKESDPYFSGEDDSHSQETSRRPRKSKSRERRRSRSSTRRRSKAKKETSSGSHSSKSSKGNLPIKSLEFEKAESVDGTVEIVYTPSAGVENDFSQKNLIRLFDLKAQIDAARVQKKLPPPQPAVGESALELYQENKGGDARGKFDLGSLLQLKRQVEKQRAGTSQPGGQQGKSAIEELKQSLKMTIKDALQSGAEQSTQNQTQNSLIENNQYRPTNNPPSQHLGGALVGWRPQQQNDMGESKLSNALQPYQPSKEYPREQY